MPIPRRKPDVEVPFVGGPVDGTVLMFPAGVERVSTVEVVGGVAMLCRYDLVDGKFQYMGSEPIDQ